MSDDVSIEIIRIASKILKQGGVIAYPTEGVYGFGCNPLNEMAATRLMTIKGRDKEKGFVLVAESWSQLARYVGPLPEDRLKEIMATWPGPMTWVFPAKKSTPPWIQGNNDSVAVRVSEHPLIKRLCHEFKGAIVSTSANIQGESPAVTYEEVCDQFKEKLDLIIQGKTGPLGRATPIKDALTGKVLRP